MKILVLGHNGMLGHMLVKYFTDAGFVVETIDDKFPNESFLKNVKRFDGEYIINAIGAIPQKTSVFLINTDLPIWLDQNVKCKIIHPGTDCEVDDDEYGISKKQARDYIVQTSTHTKILRSSIIGPELQSKKSLLEWFLNTNDQCNGYTEAMWNGITTYEWAKQCRRLIESWDMYETETIVSGNCISKFDLLQTIALVFGKQINIVPINNGTNKCLVPSIQTLDIKQQLQELKEYYYDN